MTNRSIARRAGFVAAAPLAGLLALSAHNLDESRDALQTARITEAAASVLPEICAFLHAIQAERGAAIMPAEAARSAPMTALRRTETDAAADAMIAEIQRHAPLLQGEPAAAPRATLRIAEAAARERDVGPGQLAHRHLPAPEGQRQPVVRCLLVEAAQPQPA